MEFAWESDSGAGKMIVTCSLPSRSVWACEGKQIGGSVQHPTCPSRRRCERTTASTQRNLSFHIIHLSIHPPIHPFIHLLIHSQSTGYGSGPGINAGDTAGNKTNTALDLSLLRSPNNRKDQELIDNHTKQVSSIGRNATNEKAHEPAKHTAG